MKIERNFKTIIGFLLLIILLAGIAAGTILVKKRQETRGKAAFKSYLEGDFNQDEKIDHQDLLIFREKCAAQDLSADFDHSGEVNSLDYNLLLWKMK